LRHPLSNAAVTLLLVAATACSVESSTDTEATAVGGAAGSTSDTGGAGGAAGAGGQPGAGGQGGSEAPPEGWVLVPSGAFIMGSPADEPGRSAELEAQHEVTLTHSLLVKATEVTQDEWLASMGSNPAFFFECGGDCPVENVNWWEALEYCNALSAAQGLTECYELTGCTGTVGLDRMCASVTVSAADGNPYLCEGYRLPTEAEWEHAARAGTTEAFFAGGFLPDEVADNECRPVQALESSAWYCANATDLPHPVASLGANGWQLYDTSGNAFEWVWDGFGPYADGPATDPTGDAEALLRGLRGGSWSRVASICRSAAREALDPAERDGDTGLRPVRTAPTQ
jgi:formylglycine-generating enzyme required for sulfatase activity